MKIGGNLTKDGVRKDKFSTFEAHNLFFCTQILISLRLWNIDYTSHASLIFLMIFVGCHWQVFFCKLFQTIVAHKILLPNRSLLSNNIRKLSMMFWPVPLEFTVSFQYLLGLEEKLVVQTAFLVNHGWCSPGNKFSPLTAQRIKW